MARSSVEGKASELTRGADWSPTHDLTLWIHYELEKTTFEVTEVVPAVNVSRLMKEGLPLLMLRDIINDDQGWKGSKGRNYSIRVARRTPHPLISRLSSASIRRKYDDLVKDSLPYVKVKDWIQVSPLKPDALTNLEYLTDGSPMMYLKLLILSQDKPKQPRSDRSRRARNFGIIVRTQTEKYISLNVKATDKVMDLKMMISDKEGTPVEQQRMIYAGKELEDERTVGHYKIKPDSTVHLILRLRGS